MHVMPFAQLMSRPWMIAHYLPFRHATGVSMVVHGWQRERTARIAIKLATYIHEMAACLGLILRKCKHLANKQSLVSLNVFTRDARKHMVSLFDVV
jgi:hypothetical protein